MIIGNPPYQLSTGSDTAQAIPLYHKFVETAKRLNPRFLTMIIPSRWYAGGMGLDDFRHGMLNDGKISHLVDYKKASDCFPGVNIGGGVCYFLWRNDHNGPCVVTNIHDSITTQAIRPLNEFNIFVKYNQAVSIIKKVRAFKEDVLSAAVSSISPFGISTKIRGVETINHIDRYALHSSKGVTYVSIKEIPKGSELINRYKVLLSQLIPGKAGEIGGDGKHPVFASTIKVIGPNEVCSHSYLAIGSFGTYDEANNLLSYLKTSFVRFLVYMCVSSIHLTKNTFQFVPMQDFSKSWTDEELYKKYGLKEDDIAFIESMIRPME